MPQPGAKRDARMDHGSPFVPITGKIIHFMTIIQGKIKALTGAFRAADTPFYQQDHNL